MEIARKHRLPVVEDAACAIGSEIRQGSNWEKLGKPHADIACFSFHPRKLLTTGDGGMLTTASEEWDAGFRLRRQHAMSVPDTVRHKSTQVVFESYEEVGFNYRMTDIQAAIGREQLKRLPEVVERRQKMAKRYHEMLSEAGGIIPPHEPKWARSNWQSYCVRLPKELDQPRVMQQMLEDGVSTRRGVMCAHREPPYRDESISRIAGSLKQSEEAQDHCILLPLFHQLTEEQQDRVVISLKSAIAARAVAR
jgi:dTDP-4-amino-4,6-dideoxygalactose transaminase